MDFQNVDKINLAISLNVVVFFISFVGPGFLLWYVHSPELFERLDFFKLLFLAVAVSTPTFLLPFSYTALKQRIISVEHPELLPLWGDPVDWYLRHGLINALNMYAVIFLMWWLELDTRGVVFLVLGVMISNVIGEIIGWKLFLRRPNSLYWIVLDRKTNKVSEDV
ncbi:hypothetical protein [Pseudomonas sp. BC115LW]|uniref:hypothetical protein n=1 Tax=Pseudomonas sp. BC115LW TaxID=2683267 RepID=UPI001411F46D|nr:hypothetical protein [Pseudomonas sp. BC115LW]NBB33154.1 hypothetical protein [Pseudomonas sp. BC115LW]